MMGIARSGGRFGACILALVVLVGIQLSRPAHAQLAGATLTGVVTDKSGAVVGGATIQIKNLDNGQVREVTSNESGLYSAPNLPPGPYEVKVTASGFTSAVQKGIELNVGMEQALNITLQVGKVNETVEVNDLTPAIETTSSTVGATVEQRTVVELPLNGRDWTQLATLQPGVISVRAQASTGATANRGNRGFGDQLADSGHRPNENTYRVDGININDYSNGAPGSVLGASLGVDAIQEFSVVTTNYTAEYGRTSGAVINAITRSGTNHVHGTGYFFDRDKIFDARNFFDGPNIPPFRRLQFGGSIGAPIIKDRTFIFGDYEGVRQGQSLSLTPQILSPAALAGNLCSVPANPPTCTPHRVTIDSKVLPFLKLWQPVHGIDTGPVTSFNGDVDTFRTSGIKVLNENYFTVRGDHKISDKDSLSATFFYDKAPQTQPDTLDNVIHSVFTQRHTLALTETHIFNSAMGNTFRFGYGHVTGLVNTPVSAINPVGADTSLCTVCSPTPLPAALIQVDGLTAAGGLGDISFFGHHYNTYQANDDVFLTKSKHALKFGFAFEYMQYNVLSKVRGNGNFVFSTLQASPGVTGIENFLTNNPEKVLLLSPSVRKETQSRDSLFGVYVQDDWRLRPRLTVNLGLRYEMLTNPTESHNGFGFLSNFYTSPAPSACPGSTGCFKNVFANNPTTRNFDPRIGFSWDPTGSGKTAIRAGFGVFSVLPLPYVYTIGDSLTLPFSLQTSFGSSSNPLPQGAFPVIPDSVNFSNSAGSRYIDRSPKRSFASNWNINIQHELTSKIAVMAGYVGSRTVHNAFTADDANQVVPPKVNGVFTWPCSGDPCVGGGGTIANPNVGFIRPIFFDGASSYEGFQSQVQLRNVRSVQAQLAYTYSNCKDTGSGAQLGDPFQNSLTSLMFFDKAHRYGACDFDIRHNLIANYIWTLPTPDWGGAAKWIAGGWQVGGIVNVSSGVPFTLVLDRDVLGQNYTDAPYDYPNRVPGCNPIAGTRIDPVTHQVNYINNACFVVAPPLPNGGGLVLGNNGRNSLYGPKLVNVDFSVFKNTHITERFVAQFRAEFFNIFNHTNFQAPLNNYTLFIQPDGSSVKGAGLLDSTITTSRQIQLGLKLTF
jgi:carboxypeptidase family protein